MINQLSVLLPMVLAIGGVTAVYLVASILMDFYMGALVIEIIEE